VFVNLVIGLGAADAGVTRFGRKKFQVAKTSFEMPAGAPVVANSARGKLGRHPRFLTARPAFTRAARKHTDGETGIRRAYSKRRSF
jgi:hypothetical protein